VPQHNQAAEAATQLAIYGANFLLQLRLLGANQLVHLLTVLQEEERWGRADVPRRAELLW
jgi:hypothetical protein